MTRQQKSVIAGAILGAAFGAMGGYLFTRGLETGDGQVRSVSMRSVPTGELVRVLVSIMAVLRGVAEMGEKAKV